MDTQILSHEMVNGKHFLSLTCGKTAAFVSVAPGEVNVTCQNASHRVFRSVGRTFATWDAAHAAYTSRGMQAILIAAQKLIENKS